MAAFRPESTSRSASPGKFRIAWATLAAAFLTACYQSEPPEGDPGLPPAIPEIPEDPGRRAGSTSSTNWPSEFGQHLYQLQGRSDGFIVLYFLEIMKTEPFDIVPRKLSGSLEIYKSGTIPALDSTPPKSLSFENADSVQVPAPLLDSLGSDSSDLVTFNIRVKADSFQVWLFDFEYSRAEGKCLRSPFSDSSSKTVLLKVPRHYFRGNLKVDSTLIPPVPGESEFSFYIPGTSVYAPVADTGVQIGPLPSNEYPLRLLRLSHPPSPARETLIEAWEVRVNERFFDSSITPGAKVLDVRVKGELELLPAH